MNARVRIATNRTTALRVLFILGAIAILGIMPNLPTEAVSAESELSGSAIDSTRAIDPGGLTTWRSTRQRSPSGILYPYPRQPPPWNGDEFQLRSLIDVGYVAHKGEANEASFQKYADRSDGLLVSRFMLEGQQRDSAFYFEIGGGSVGRSDQFYYAEAGQHGFFRVRGGFDSLEHVSMDDARVLFDGAGSEQLTLPTPLLPGLNSRSDVNLSLSSIGPSTLSQKREETEVEFRIGIHPQLTFMADYKVRKRDGERPFGGTLGVTFSSEFVGSVAETIAPEESRTHDFSVGLQYSAKNWQTNLRYRGSIYDNQNTSLTWENPFARLAFGATVLQGIPRGRAALAPDNELHQIAADVGVELPLNGRLTTHVAWTRMDQNQRLLPATINPALTDFDVLSRSRADARVDHLLVDTKIRMRPTPAVGVKFTFRYEERDNDTNYQSVNPTTGQFGYVTEDETLTNRRGAVPFSMRRYRAKGSIDWRFAKRSRMGIRFQHETSQRGNRARREVHDESVRVHASTALIPHTQLRVSYSFLQRRGSNYSSSRDQRYYDAPGPGLPPRTGGPSRSLQNFRQFDIGSQDTHEIALRSNWLIGARIDVALAAHYQMKDFRTSYGVTDSRRADVSLDTSIQISPSLVGYGFANFEWRENRLTTVNGAIGLGPSTDFSAGSARFPFSNRWDWDSKTSSFTLGAGLIAQPHPRVELRLDYRFQRSNEIVDLEFDRTGGALTLLSDPTNASTRFPSLKQIDHDVSASATYRWTDSVLTRIFYQFRHQTIDDYHQQGLQSVVNHNLYLGHIDDGYSTHVIGATVRLQY